MRFRTHGFGMAVLVGALLAADLASAGWLWWRKDKEYDPHPGGRSVYHKGHVWPVQPRPTTPPARHIDQYHASIYWPSPYLCHDRASVRNSLDMVAAQGWLNHTTMHDYYFDPQTNELNSSGRMHLQWIVLEAPPQYKSAFVAAGLDDEVNQTRLLNVQMTAMQLAGNGTQIPVSLRQAIPHGASAQEIDLARRAWLTTMPKPRIDYQPPTLGGEEQ